MAEKTDLFEGEVEVPMGDLNAGETEEPAQSPSSNLGSMLAEWSDQRSREYLKTMKAELPAASESEFARRALPAVAPIVVGAATGAMLPAAIAPGLSLATRAGKLIHGLLTGAGYATGELATNKLMDYQKVEEDPATTKKFLLNVLVPFMGEGGTQAINSLAGPGLTLLGKTVRSILGGGGGAALANYLSGEATGQPFSWGETAGVAAGGAVGQTMADTMRSLTQGPNLNDPNVQTAIKYGIDDPGDLASARPAEFLARRLMVSAGIVGTDEQEAAGQVLTAAFLTYVAAAVSSLLTFLYYLMRSGLLGGRRSD